MGIKFPIPATLDTTYTEVDQPLGTGATTTTVVVTAPAGTNAISGGGYMQDTAVWAISESRPVANQTEWRVSFVLVSGTPSSGATAVAFCVSI
jgi:hypothetical protein